MASEPNIRSYTKRVIGDEDPIPAGGRRRAPDRREVSLRWLSGTFLTGVTSTVLMGVALFAALDGKQLLATPPEVFARQDLSNESENDNIKTSRLVPLITEPEKVPVDRHRMSVSTVTRVGDADVVRTKPFEHLKIELSAGHKTNKNYPGFNPLTIFAETPQIAVSSEKFDTLIYGAEVETEASIRMDNFQLDEEMKKSSFDLTDEEVEKIVRETAPILTEGSVEVAALYYVDPARFGVSDPALATLDLQPAAKIVPQNVSISPQKTDYDPSRSFAEDIIVIRDDSNLLKLLEKTGYQKATPMAEAMSALLATENAKSGHMIRLGLQGSLVGQEIVRASLYSGREHLLTIAINDENRYVPAQEPFDPGILTTLRDEKQSQQPINIMARDLPRAYDAIYHGIMAYELPQDIAAQIVRMVAADVDFNAPIKPDDRLELFYSVPEESDTQSNIEELLFVEAKFNGQLRTFYRFRSNDGIIDYFDENGRSAKQFLLRNPVPTGKFRSPFGMRRHPVLKYARMHWGVDWSAPRGTPIIAPGNGTVKKAGWAGGYGRQTIIKHANGYETSYSHQSRFAKGIRPGARVRQGQVIGYIGTTGLSTGPHLHYEMKVNGKRVDPLRVRLPKGKTLKGAELEAFINERDRINDLLQKTDAEPDQIASIQG